MEFYDLGVRRGETFRQALVFKDSDGNVIDLSGCTGYSQVRPDVDSADLICSMTVTVDGPTGTVTLSVAADVTKQIPAGVYVYDFAMKNPSNAVRFYLGGKFAVIPAVTEIG